MDILIIVFFEVLFRGPGYLLVKLFKQSKPEVNGFLVISVSLLFWFIVSFAAYGVYVNFYPGMSE